MVKKATVIGAGPGGYIAAIRAAQLGAEVTLVEQEGIGGTCLNRGCIPSKVLKTTAEILEKFHRAGEFGIEVNGRIRADLKALMVRKEAVVESQAKGIINLLQHHKIRYVKGRGTIQRPDCVVVQSSEGTMHEISSERLILALGSQPMKINSVPFDGKTILSSDNALDLREIPGSLLILGGGVIGCEFACIFSSLGSRVTIVEALSRLLPIPSVDDECSKVLQREMKKRGITLMLNRTVDRVDVADTCHVTIGLSPFTQDLKEKDMKSVTVDVDKVLVCIGRAPNTADIGLKEIGVEMDNRGWIIANERMETGVSGVYAIGDVLGPSKVMLAHVASTEGLVAAENTMGGKQVMRYDAVPGAIFTMPEIANVGLTESQAGEHGYHVRADSVLFRNLGKAHAIGEIAGEAKIVSDADSGRVLGVHIIGPHATDLIAEGTLAVKTGCTVRELAETIHAHPTLPEIMMEVSFKALDRSLHG